MFRISLDKNIIELVTVQNYNEFNALTVKSVNKKNYYWLDN